MLQVSNTQGQHSLLFQPSKLNSKAPISLPPSSRSTLRYETLQFSDLFTFLLQKLILSQCGFGNFSVMNSSTFELAQSERKSQQRKQTLPEWFAHVQSSHPPSPPSGSCSDIPVTCPTGNVCGPFIENTTLPQSLSRCTGSILQYPMCTGVSSSSLKKSILIPCQ